MGGIAFQKLNGDGTTAKAQLDQLIEANQKLQQLVDKTDTHQLLIEAKAIFPTAVLTPFYETIEVNLNESRALSKRVYGRAVISHYNHGRDNGNTNRIVSFFEYFDQGKIVGATYGQGYHDNFTFHSNNTEYIGALDGFRLTNDSNISNGGKAYVTVFGYVIDDTEPVEPPTPVPVTFTLTDGFKAVNTVELAPEAKIYVYRKPGVIEAVLTAADNWSDYSFYVGQGDSIGFEVQNLYDLNTTRRNFSSAPGNWEVVQNNVAQWIQVDLLTGQIVTFDRPELIEVTFNVDSEFLLENPDAVFSVIETDTGIVLATVAANGGDVQIKSFRPAVNQNYSVTCDGQVDYFGGIAPVALGGIPVPCNSIPLNISGLGAGAVFEDGAVMDLKRAYMIQYSYNSVPHPIYREQVWPLELITGLSEAVDSHIAWQMLLPIAGKHFTSSIFDSSGVLVDSQSTINGSMGSIDIPNDSPPYSFHITGFIDNP